MKSPTTDNIRFVYLASAVLIVLGLIIPVLPLHLGFYPWKDEEYQLLCMADYRNNPLSGFTMYIGYLWSHYIGEDSFISFRILAYLCNTVSILIPSCYYFIKTGKLFQSACIFFVLQLAISAFGLFSYEWDSMSYLTITLCCVAALSYYECHAHYKVVTLGLLGAVCIYSRIPNIALIPVVLLLIAVTDMRIKVKIVDYAIFLVSLLLGSEILNLLIWGGHEEFLKSWNTDNVITGHNSIIGMVVAQFWSSYHRVFRDMALWLAIFSSVWYVCHVAKRKSGKIFGTAFIGLLTLSLFLMIRATTHDYHNYYIEFFLFTVLLLPAIAVYRKQPVKRPLIYSLILLGFSLVSMAGSDIGIAKLLCFPLIPLALCELRKFKSLSVRAFFIMSGVVVIFSYPILRIKDPTTKDWINLYTDSYGSIPKLKGIKGPASDVKFVTDIYSWAMNEKKRNRKILFIGPKRYLFDYILNNDKDWINRYPVQHYHDDNDYGTIEPKLDGFVDGFDFVFLSFSFDGRQLQQVQQTFSQKGFQMFKRDDNYIIYRKCQPEK